MVVVFLGALGHLLMCTQTNMHKLQLTLCICGGDDCMWWWLYVVVVAVRGGDGHHVWQCWYYCMIVSIRSWWLWSIINEDATIHTISININIHACVRTIKVTPTHPAPSPDAT